MMREPQRENLKSEATTVGGDSKSAPGGNPTYPLTTEDAASYQLLTQYLQRRRLQIGQLTAALDNADYELIRRIGHNLHGSGAAYGLPRVSAIGSALEAGAERADPGAVGDNIRQLEDFLASVVLKQPPTPRQE